ncbi:MAG: class I SAM-dependent methyltransferase [Mobilicoccus sp.]|nr:class I SAM-dependent methyltransferase [Mobilicoccus sp.]
MDADTARLLLDAGLPLLGQVPDYDEADALALGTRLRRAGHSPELVAAVLTQARLRERARPKFGALAERMLFTPDGLEQSTRRGVADLHAARFADAGISTVHDLGCGLGADSQAFARAGLAVEAVDADEATALLAAHNTSTPVTGHPAAQVAHARAEDVPLAPDAAAWFDPARRTPGRTDATGRTRRTFRLEDMAPTWQHVLAVAEKHATGAKLSPAFPHAERPEGSEAQWVSVEGDLVECVVWWGLARTSGRVATLLVGDDVVEVTEADAPHVPVGALDPAAGLSLHEPDLAVLQAGLVGALAAATDGSELAAGVGYVVSDSTLDLPYARRFTITDVLPPHPKVVKAWLRQRDITGATIKRRGGRQDPEEFRRRIGLGTKGGDQATLLLTDGPGGPVCLVLSRE